MNPTQLINEASKEIALLAPTPPKVAPIADMADSVTALTAKRDAAKTANDAYEAGKLQLDALKTTRDETAAALGVQVVQTATDAESASGGSATQLQNAGYALVGTQPGPAPAVQQAQNLALSPGKMPATAQAKCAPDPQAIGYEWQVTTGDALSGPYVTNKHSSAAKATLTGLTSGQRIWVRVRALGRGEDGEGPWSDPATIIVP
ncbi:MAG: fibronectin type III domain-containing protein [Chthoniobacteraceae bacterium]